MERIGKLIEKVEPGLAMYWPPPPPEPRRTFQPVTLDTLDTGWHPRVRVAVLAAQLWLKRRQRGETAGLVLIASPIPGDITRTGYGCGKTHIARACLHTDCYWLDGRPVAAAGQFWSANDIIQRLDAETPASVEVGSAAIVVIDDVGTEQTIPYIAALDQERERQSRYFKLIDYCYGHGVSVVITGNLTWAQLQQRIGGRAWSRLQEMAPKGQMVDLTAVPDWRTRGRQ
jgi:hypothetical protein